MADPFSVGAGIVGVIGLTLQVAQTVVQLGLDWKDAPKDVKIFMAEVHSLRKALSDIHTNLILNKDFQDAFQDTNQSILVSELGPNAPADTATKKSMKICTDALEGLLRDLQKRDAGHRLGWERFKGPFLTKSTQKAVENLHRQCQNLNNIVSLDALSLQVDSHKQISETRQFQKNWYQNEEDQKILHWYSRFNFEQKQQDILSKRHTGTGQWLLDLEAFKGWRDAQVPQSATFWCPGAPGAGKSVMAAAVIENLQQSFKGTGIVTIYIYCDYKDRERQTTSNLLADLIKQLILQMDAMPIQARELYQRSIDSGTSLEDYKTVLYSLVKNFKRSYIILDALDENTLSVEKDSTEEHADMELVHALLPLQSRDESSTRFLITSRESPLIERSLPSCVHLTIRANDEDVRSYVDARIKDATRFRFAQEIVRRPDLESSIIDTIVTKAQGIFLLPHLYLDQLNAQTSVRALRKALDRLPFRLHATYDEAMMRIHSQIEEEKALALRALLWISTSFRPLSVQELRHALAVNPEDEDFDEEGLIDPNLIVSVCAGLIAIDTESKTIRLVHFTVDEYFRTTKGRWFPDAHVMIAMTCLTYVSFLSKGRCLGREQLDISARDFGRGGLSNYALVHWGDHASKQESIAFQDHAMEIFQDDEKVQAVSLYHFVGHGIPGLALAHSMFSSPWPPFGVHILAFEGLLDTLKRVFRTRITPDRWQSTAQRLLSYAALGHHASIIEFLVTSCNADMNAQVGDWSKLLYHAVKYDNVASVEALVSHGAEIRNHKPNMYRDLLVRIEVIKTAAGALKLLLEHGANPNVLSAWLETPLYTAFNQGDLAKARLLLGHGANPNILCAQGQIALHEAASEGAIDGNGISLVEALLKAGCDINATDERGKTPLHYAVDDEMVAHLLHHGADPEIEDMNGKRYNEWRVRT